MSHRYQKGSKRPDPRTSRDRGRRDHGYTLQGGVPWPTWSDGTMYADAQQRVHHVELGDSDTGTIRGIEWAHPDGSYMDGAKREDVKKATVTLPERRTLKPGAWWAVVSWDAREDHPEVTAKCLLENLYPAQP